MLKFLEIVKKNYSEYIINKEAQRLFHGRGKLIPEYDFLNIDIFSSTMLLTFFKNCSEAELESILSEIAFIEIENIVIHIRNNLNPDIKIVKGVLNLNELALEHGLNFKINLGKFQNIGLFLDMKNVRKYLIENSKNKKVLNLFSYTCALSLASGLGEAREVVNVDMSKNSLKTGEENHLLNLDKLKSKKIRYLAFNILTSWKKFFQFGPYDLIIIDPPTNQKDSFNAERDYYKIIKRVTTNVTENAEIIACLNSPHLSSNFLMDLFKEHAPDFECMKRIDSGFISMELDVEAGLKVLIFKKKALV